MITHIQGKLTEKNPTDVVIDCNGVGYLLNISMHTYSQIPDAENLKLYTHLQVKEDSHWREYCKNNVIVTNTKTSS